MSVDQTEPAEIQAVSRVAQILSLFGLNRPELTAVEAAELLGLNRSTAYRYCTSLVAAGILEKGTTQGSFMPGRLLLQLGAFAIGRRKVMDLASPYLRDLAARTQLTAVLSLWGASGAVVSRVEENSSRASIVTVRVGTQLSLDTAQAKLFLAFLPDQLAVLRLLSNLPAVQQKALTHELERIRSDQQCIAVTPDGIVAVGAPIFDEYGICATIAVVGTERSLPVTDSFEVRAVAETALTLSTALGGASDGLDASAT